MVFGTAERTLKIQILEQNAILVIPSFAHVHTVWFIQLCELGRCISHECLGFYPSHGLSLPRLDFRSLLVHTSPDLLLPENLTTLLSVIRRSCAAIGSGVTISGSAGGGAAIFGGRGKALFLILKIFRIVGLKIARQSFQWLFEERHLRAGVWNEE